MLIFLILKSVTPDIKKAHHDLKNEHTNLKNHLNKNLKALNQDQISLQSLLKSQIISIYPPTTPTSSFKSLRKGHKHVIVVTSGLISLFFAFLGALVKPLF